MHSFYIHIFSFSLNVIRSIEESVVHFSRSAVHTADFDLLGNTYRFFHDLSLNLKENDLKMKSSCWFRFFNLISLIAKNLQK